MRWMLLSVMFWQFCTMSCSSPPDRIVEVDTGATVDAGEGDTTVVGDSQAPDVVLPGVDTTVDSGARRNPDAGQPADSLIDGQEPIEPEDTRVTCAETQKGFLCPCDQNEQCASGYCVPANLADSPMVCTVSCVDTCPNDWMCKFVQLSSDPIFLCLPEIQDLCEPCELDEDCGGSEDRCLSIGDSSHCGVDCSAPDAGCPPNYHCADLGEGLQQCIPDSDSCDCGPDVDYQTDIQNCGSCGEQCEFFGGVAQCIDGNCVLGDCLDDYYDLDGDPENGCEYACVYTSDEDDPDADLVDTNCDGIDGDIENAVFVSPEGADTSTGTMDDPVATVSKALALAQAESKPHVYVAAGNYDGQVTLANGLSIYGGYSPNGEWERDPALYLSVLFHDIPGSSGDILAVVADGVSEETVVGDLTIRSGNNPTLGGGSYALWIRDSYGLTVRGCRLIAGNGGDGSVGMPGSAGSDGQQGADGTSTTDTDCNCNEPETYGGFGGAGGAANCTDETGFGGKGADGSCKNQNGVSGAPGWGGTPGGLAGQPGVDGLNGSAGTLGASALGQGVLSEEGLWVSEAGLSGEPGTAGAGGGGGGSGDGDDNGTFGCAIWGGGGGGGGGGGCGGLGGGGGGGGGGSFAAFVVNSAPVFEQNVFVHKNGGSGGSGGSGGAGGQGKTGGSGGTGYKEAGSGAAGGQGGGGGVGGNGGGGAGGVAYGLYLGPDASPYCEDNEYEPQGIGGLGGGSGLNKGVDGDHGSQNVATGGCS